MNSEKWDKRFLELAEHVSQWSKDPSTKVGAVLVEPSKKLVVGLGFNGFPRGVDDTPERLSDRDTKYRFVVHAEVNAILMAGERSRGSTLYVVPSFAIPCICNECAKVAIQAGVKEIVGYTPSPDAAERAKRWYSSLEAAKQMCDEAGVKYRGL